MKHIKSFFIITISITIMAIGVYFFKFPNNFTFGGVTGAAVVFANLLPVSASMFSTIANMILLAVAAVIGMVAAFFSLKKKDKAN